MEWVLYISMDFHGSSDIIVLYVYISFITCTTYLIILIYTAFSLEYEWSANMLIATSSVIDGNQYLNALNALNLNWNALKPSYYKRKEKEK